MRACGLEYSGRRPFAQPANAADRSFLRLLWEIGRWLRTARRSLDELDCERWTLERYLDERRYSPRFRRHFLVPLTSALWSTAPGRALEFPAAYAIRFFDNHGMLGFGRFRWRTVTGGADTYVDALARRLGAAASRSGSASGRSGATPDGVELRTATTRCGASTRVVVATHADQALAAPRGSDRRTSAALLGAFAYTRNDAIAPHGRVASCRDAGRARLVELPARRRRPPDDHVLPQPAPAARGGARLVRDAQRATSPRSTSSSASTFEHPLFTVDALAAQRELPRLAGARRTWFAGAYHGNGFHEDGLASGVRAADALGVAW